MAAVRNINWDTWDPFHLFDENLTAPKYALLREGDRLQRERYFDRAIPIYEQVLQEARRIHDRALEASALLHSAEARRRQSRWREAIQDYRHALQCGVWTDNHHNVGSIYWMMGLCAQAAAEYREALGHFSAAFEQFKRLIQMNGGEGRPSNWGKYTALAEEMRMLHSHAEALAQGAREREMAAEAEQAERARLRATVDGLQARVALEQQQRQDVEEHDRRLILQVEDLELRAVDREQEWNTQRARLETRINDLEQERQAIEQDKQQWQVKAVDLDKQLIEKTEQHRVAEIESQRLQAAVVDLERRATAEQQEKQQLQATAADAQARSEEEGQRRQQVEKDKQQWQAVAEDYQRRLAEAEEQRQEVEKDKRQWRAVAEEFQRQFAEDANQPLQIRPKVTGWIATMLADMGYSQEEIDVMTAEQVVYILGVKRTDASHQTEPPRASLEQDFPESMLEAIPVFEESLAAGDGVWLADEDRQEGYVTSAGFRIGDKRFHLMHIGSNEVNFRLKLGFQYRATRVSGTSMERACIEDKDYVILQNQVGVPYWPVSGDIVAAVVPDGADRLGVVKRVKLDEDIGLLHLEPMSYNDEHKSRTFDLREPDKLPQFVGKVVAVLKEIRPPQQSSD